MEYLNIKILNYRLTRFIGEGGMASVYEGTHEKLGTKVAIKILNPVLTANKQIRQRFENEAKMMASLNHPNITRVMDYDEQKDMLAIVMELLDGTNLASHIKTKGALTPEHAIPIFTQVLDAFIYAHTKGIIHRDIKPSNIFLDSENQVKILDFGIAKLLEAGDDFTSTGTQLGTPTYMSPEQVKAEKNIDQRTDIYSLGVTLFFLLNGKPPYDSSTQSNFEIFNKIVYEPIPDLKHYPEIDAIIKTAVAKDRNLRFPDARAFKNALLEPATKATPVAEEKTKKETLKTEKASLQSSPDDDDKTWVDLQNEVKIKPFVLEKVQTLQPENQKKIPGAKTANPKKNNSYGVLKLKLFHSKFFLTLFIIVLVCGVIFFISNQVKMAKLKKIEMKRINDSIVFAQEMQRDEDAWKTANETMTIDAFQTYISENPEGKYISDAELEMNAIRIFNYPMVFIPRGTFKMGSNDGRNDEKPVHTVNLTSYYIGKYEVTQAQWKEIIGNNPSEFSGCDNCPVESVSWNDVQDFIMKLNQKTGKNYRLPIEAEWEYAAGNGSIHTKYSWGNGDPYGMEGGNVADKTAKRTFYDWPIFEDYDDGFVYTAPVGSYNANEFGLYDLTGNVWEWCCDWYCRDYYKGSPAYNPMGPESGDYRVYRGGSWGGFPDECCVTYREMINPEHKGNFLGFRLAQDDPFVP